MTMNGLDWLGSPRSQSNCWLFPESLFYPLTPTPPSIHASRSCAHAGRVDAAGRPRAAVPRVLARAHHPRGRLPLARVPAGGVRRQRVRGQRHRAGREATGNDTFIFTVTRTLPPKERGRELVVTGFDERPNVGLGRWTTYHLKGYQNRLTLSASGSSKTNNRQCMGVESTTGKQTTA